MMLLPISAYLLAAPKKAPAKPTPVSTTVTKEIEVPFKKGEDALVVDALVNGKPCSFMFDTGFSGVIVLDTSIDIGKATGVMNLRDFVGEFQAPTVPIKSLQLGAMKLDSKDWIAVKQEQGRMSENYDTHCDGIMGLETIKNYVTEFNFKKNCFIFHPNSYDISKFVPDNKNTFLIKMLPMGGNSVELEVKNAAGKPITLALDTGNAFYGTTHKDVLEDLGMWKVGDKPKYARQSGVASGAVDSFYMLMKDMTIFGVPVKKSVWSIIDLPSSSAEHSGTIGYQFLKNFNFTIDMARRRVWFEKISSPEREPVADLGILGAWFDQKNRVILYKILAGGPGEKAGLKNFDELLSIDGQDLDHDMSYHEIERVFQGPKGSKAKLVISRNGQLKRIEVARDYTVNGM